VFLANLAPDGTLRWALALGGDADDLARGLAVRADGGALVYGEFTGAIEFEPGQGLTAGGARALFVAHYRFDGVLLDAAATAGLTPAIGGTDVGQGGIAVFPDGGFAIAGAYVGELRLGATRLLGAPLQLRCFVARGNADLSFR
jgi:hypothetical protein